MAKMIMGVGIPGSGKTTALKPFAEKNGYTYICPDDIRAELSGDAIDHSRNSEVWDEVRKRVDQALCNGDTVVVDATFARDFERKNFIQFARDHGAEKVQGVFTAVPFDIASERNEARDRVVPGYVMDRMHNMLKENPPIVEDGFDSVFDINEFQELKRSEMRGEDDVLTREFKQNIR